MDNSTARAIAVRKSRLYVRDSVIQNHRSLYYGGGVACLEESECEFTRSAIRNNQVLYGDNNPSKCLIGGSECYSSSKSQILSQGCSDNYVPKILFCTQNGCSYSCVDASGVSGAGHTRNSGVGGGGIACLEGSVCRLKDNTVLALNYAANGREPVAFKRAAMVHNVVVLSPRVTRQNALTAQVAPYHRANAWQNP